MGIIITEIELHSDGGIIRDIYEQLAVNGSLSISDHGLRFTVGATKVLPLSNPSLLAIVDGDDSRAFALARREYGFESKEGSSEHE
jgi:hypothetical protein